MCQALIAYHGTTPEAPLIGGQDPVSHRTLDVLWASSSYDLAAQFQDGMVLKLSIDLHQPLILTEEERAARWPGLGHAQIVGAVQVGMYFEQIPLYDGIIFRDTIDGLEAGDVIVVFPNIDDNGLFSVDHAVTVIGRRSYDEIAEDWVSEPDF